MGILWTLLIGFLAGVIAKFLHPGPNEPSGFIVTTLLGVAGAFVATYLGQAIGWYQPGEGAGLIGAVVARCRCRCPLPFRRISVPCRIFCSSAPEAFDFAQLAWRATSSSLPNEPMPSSR